jgi:hypothetical protein
MLHMLSSQRAELFLVFRFFVTVAVQGVRLDLSPTICTRGLLIQHFSDRLCILTNGCKLPMLCVAAAL